MDPQTKLLTDMLTRGILSMEQFAAEMARRSGSPPRIRAWLTYFVRRVCTTVSGAIAVASRPPSAEAVNISNGLRAGQTDCCAHTGCADDRAGNQQG